MAKKAKETVEIPMVDLPSKLQVLLSATPVEVQTAANKYLFDFLKGHCRVMNDVPVQPPLKGVANPRPLDEAAVVTLSTDIEGRPEREAHEIVYLIAEENLPEPGTLAASLEEVVRLDVTDRHTFMLQFPADGKLWRIAGNHRVEANKRLKQRLEESVKLLQAEQQRLTDAGEDEGDEFDRLTKLIASYELRVWQASWWYAKIYIIPDFFLRDTVPSEETFVNETARQAWKAIVTNRYSFAWYGASHELFRTFANTVMPAKDNFAAVEDWTKRFLATAMGEDAERMTPHFLTAFYNPYARQFLLAAGEDDTSTEITKPSLAVETLTSAWSGGQGSSWGYIVLLGALNARLKIHRHPKCPPEPCVPDVIEYAVSATCSHFSHLINPGKWPRRGSADRKAFLDKLKHEISCGIDEFPEQKAKYPHLRKLLGEFAIAVVAMFDADYPDLIPPYCGALVAALAAVFFKLRFTFRLCELLTDATVLWRGSVSTAQGTTKNADASTGFIRNYLTVDQSHCDIVNHKLHLPAPFLLQWVLNVAGPNESFIRHHFHDFWDVTSASPLALAKTGYVALPEHVNPSKVFMDGFRRRIWGKIPRKKKGVEDALTLVDISQAGEIPAWFFNAYVNSPTWTTELKDATIAGDNRHRVDPMYGVIGVLRNTLRPILLNCMQDEPFALFVRSLLTMPRIDASGALSETQSFAIPLLPGFDSLDELDAAVRKYIASKLSAINTTGWGDDDLVGPVKGAPIGWSPAMKFLGQLQAAFMRNCNSISSYNRSDLAKSFDAWAESYIKLFQEDAYNREGLTPPPVPSQLKLKLDMSQVLAKPELKNWIKNGTPHEGLSAKELRKLNPLFGQSSAKIEEVDVADDESSGGEDGMAVDVATPKAKKALKPAPATPATVKPKAKAPQVVPEQSGRDDTDVQTDGKAVKPKRGGKQPTGGRKKKQAKETAAVTEKSSADEAAGGGDEQVDSMDIDDPSLDRSSRTRTKSHLGAPLLAAQSSIKPTPAPKPPKTKRGNTNAEESEPTAASDSAGGKRLAKSSPEKDRARDDKKARTQSSAAGPSTAADLFAAIPGAVVLPDDAEPDNPKPKNKKRR